MSETRKLSITISDSSTVHTALPVNTGNFVHVDNELGSFGVSVFIKNFDGASTHEENSLHNYMDEVFLNGKPFEASKSDQELSELPNLRLIVKFKPKEDIRGSEFLFGNDLDVPVKGHIPTSILATGLKFFKWFINPTIESDLYSCHPFIYGLALNSFTKIGVNVSDTDFLTNADENLLSVTDILDIPKNSSQRINFFCNEEKARAFVFEKGVTYTMSFDTNYLRLGNSVYHIVIPMIGSKTLDIDVLKYADDSLNNIDWVIKRKSANKEDDTSLRINFALM